MEEITTSFESKAEGIEATVTMPAKTFQLLSKALTTAAVIMEGTDDDLPEEVVNLQASLILAIEHDLPVVVDEHLSEKRADLLKV